MRTAHFTFTQPNFDAAVTALAKCLRKEIFDGSFKRMWMMDFFRFLINLKFQWQPRSVSCMSKTISFSKVKKSFRVSICGLLQKIVSQKTFKTFSVMREKNGVLWKRYLESAPQNHQLFQLKLLSTKLTFLMQKKEEKKNSWWIKQSFYKHWNWSGK